MLLSFIQATANIRGPLLKPDMIQMRKSKAKANNIFSAGSAHICSSRSIWPVAGHANCESQVKANNIFAAESAYMLQPGPYGFCGGHRRMLKATLKSYLISNVQIISQSQQYICSRVCLYLSSRTIWTFGGHCRILKATSKSYLISNVQIKSQSQQYICSRVCLDLTSRSIWTFEGQSRILKATLKSDLISNVHIKNKSQDFDQT